MLDRLRNSRWRWIPGLLSNFLTTIGLLAMIAGTSRELSAATDAVLLGLIMAVAACISIEFIVQVSRAAAIRGRLDYLGSARGMIDLAGAVALPLGWLLVPDPHDARLFALVWALRYMRHSTGLVMLWRVMRRSRVALISIAGLFVVVTLGGATLAYVFERGAQPVAFGSIGATLWWAVVTLTTTGYGDVVPATVWGRLLAGWVMIGGIVMFALQAGIIATAFAEELQRRHFLHTWELVTSVPFFRDLGSAAIADIVRLLQARDVSAATVVVRAGEPGDAMYFIVSGEATVQPTPALVRLGPGSFFGEMALLFHAPRSATVIATKPSVLLVLDIADFHQLAGRRPEFANLIEAEARRRREANLAAIAG